MADIDKLSEYKRYVCNYMKERLQNQFNENSLIIICGGLNSFFLDWTGNSYVSIKKEAEVEKGYQDFLN